jgi:surfeit locus 1 family protein
MNTQGRGFPVWLSLFTLVTIAILMMLGTWQVQRLDWKLGLIAEREAAMDLPPVDPFDSGADIPAEFRPVRVAGMYLHDRERHVYETSTDGKAGYHVYTPLVTAEGRAVLVNRGWVPPERKDAATRPESLIAGTVSVTGAMRYPQQAGSFTPEDDSAGNVWYHKDPAILGKGLGVDNLEQRFYVIADRTATPEGGFPRGGQIKAALKNNHLIYAITWYATGFAVFVAFLFYLFQTRRRRD